MSWLGWQSTYLDYQARTIPYLPSLLKHLSCVTVAFGDTTGTLRQIVSLVLLVTLTNYAPLGQTFHICAEDGNAGLLKYSLLCPNGTLFNQEYFICDWWFNVDCGESAAIAEAKNSELAATREAASAAAAEAAASDVVDAYAAPEGGYLAPDSADSGSGLSGYQAEYSRRS